MIITIARKPFSGSVCDNISVNQCGGISINDTRIGSEERQSSLKDFSPVWGNQFGNGSYLPTIGSKTVVGRWPTNLILSDSSSKEIDDQSGTLKSGAMNSFVEGGQFTTYGKMYPRRVVNPASEGGASRFFKVVKA